MIQAELTAEIKAYAEKVANELPERLLKGEKHKHKSRTRPSQAKPIADIEASYNQLAGEWRDWLEVAQKYEHRVPSQDRYDIRHTILLELHKARQRDGQPIPILRAYRIASLTVALYWRQIIKPLVKVCVIDGIVKEPNNGKCSFKDKPSKCRQCPFLAVRPVQSLDQSTTDYDGYECRLLDTVADDKAIEAIDIDSRVDASQWLLGCKVRLIEIATKKLDGIPLNKNDQKYLERYRKRYQLALI